MCSEHVSGDRLLQVRVIGYGHHFISKDGPLHKYIHASLPRHLSAFSLAMLCFITEPSQILLLVQGM